MVVASVAAVRWGGCFGGRWERYRLNCAAWLGVVDDGVWYEEEPSRGNSEKNTTESSNGSFVLGSKSLAFPSLNILLLPLAPENTPHLHNSSPVHPSLLGYRRISPMPPNNAGVRHHSPVGCRLTVRDSVLGKNRQNSRGVCVHEALRILPPILTLQIRLVTLNAVQFLLAFLGDESICASDSFQTPCCLGGRGKIGCPGGCNP